MTDQVADDAHPLDSRYTLREHLGTGGMGSVHLGHDRKLDRDVAIKVLHQHAEADDVRRARLQAEARLAGSLRHRGIVQVFDYGEERRDDGTTTPYVVMQHVPGRPLSAVLREEGSLDPAAVAVLVAAIADALAAAHAAGVVHRDLKPSNILVTPAGDPVLVDFGIARSDDEEPLTMTGEILGTADYLSPEQVRGQRATAASDVYALGVVAHQCLTGTSPFHRESHVATALAHLNDTVPPLPASAPEPLRQLVTEMLRDDPRQRPTAADVARRAGGTGGTGGTGSAGGTDETPTVAMSAPDRTSFRLPRPAAVAIAAALVLVAAVTVAALTGRDPAAPSASAGAADESPTAQRTRPVAARVAVDAAALRGRPYAAVRAALLSLGLDVERSDLRTGDVPAGTVVTVNPAGRVRAGSTVTVTVAVVPRNVVQHAPPPKPQHNVGPGHGPGKPKGHGKSH